MNKFPNKYVCIHGHFYQPPRENAWLEEIEQQDSAFPFHDWNERITSECYGPNTASRILDAQERIIEIVNNYSKISFNFGPTLLWWMDKHQPETYRAILEADRLSRERFSGHGSAIAQVYNHMIMPLSNSRDKRTQIKWGILDFEHRFRRKPEGMWLAETAVDLESLDMMAEQGIQFTILAPSQAKRVRKIGDKNWEDVSGARVDPYKPYLCRLPSGQSITLFFYDGPISRDIAFAGLLKNGQGFAERLLGVISGDATKQQLVHIATDGESYGHHHRFGDMALAYCLHYIESKKLAQITNYGEYLEKFPPEYEAEVYENSAWSCAHGVERWRSNCGCNTGSHPEWTQEWRGPLRIALDRLRDRLIPLYEREMTKLTRQPWQARDDYIQIVLDRTEHNLGRFIEKHAVRPFNHEDKVRLLKLLELQRHAMLMYTSCGWFFDEISGIETVQIIQYASRAIQLARELAGEELENGFLEMLRQAPSNDPEFRNGVAIYERLVKPSSLDLFRVAAHYAIVSLFKNNVNMIELYCFAAKSKLYDFHEAGVQKLAVGKAGIKSIITHEENDIDFAVLHLGGHNFIGGVCEAGEMADKAFDQMHQDMKNAFQKSDIAEAIRFMDKYFGTHSYSLQHLFRDEKRRILNRILTSAMEDIESSFRHIFESHYPVMQVMRDLNIPLPSAFSTPVQFILNTDIRNELESDATDVERLKRLIEQMNKLSFKPDKTILSYVASGKIASLMQAFERNTENWTILSEIDTLFQVLKPLKLEVDISRAQNIYFSIGKALYHTNKEKALTGDGELHAWINHFERVGEHLHVREV